MKKTADGIVKELSEKQEVIWEDRKHHLWFPLSFTKYSIENGRIYINSGFFAAREDECLLYRVLDISLTRTFLQRCFGTGTIEMNTKDRSTPVLRIENIARPVQVKRMISNLIEKDRRAKGMEGKDMYGASGHFDASFEGDIHDAEMCEWEDDNHEVE